MFKETSRHGELADPLLGGNCPKKSLSQAIAVSAMCLNEDPAVRPLMSDVVTALSYLWKGTDTEMASSPGSASSTPALPDKTTDDINNNSNNHAEERQRAIAEAIEWGSNSRNQMKRSLAS